MGKVPFEQEAQLLYFHSRMAFMGIPLFLVEEQLSPLKTQTLV